MNQVRKTIRKILSESLKGGKADDMTVKDIADKFDLSINDIEKELKMGEKVEMEHVDDKKLAREISMDHLSEFPDYYTRLKKMEKDAEDKWKKSEK